MELLAGTTAGSDALLVERGGNGGMWLELESVLGVVLVAGGAEDVAPTVAPPRSAGASVEASSGAASAAVAEAAAAAAAAARARGNGGTGPEATRARSARRSGGGGVERVTRRGIGGGRLERGRAGRSPVRGSSH